MYTRAQIIYTYPKTQAANAKDVNSPEMDFRNAYQRRGLFTANEWKNYKKLKEIADIRGLIVCPKVRLFDLIEPRSELKKKLTYRYKIQAKHVDFVICTQDMQVKAVIELDDSSHNDIERIKRDEFIDLILVSVGYTVIHTKQIEYNILDII